ncbi:BSD domain-containing protein [Actinidia rufa]|uniref:BSD domain-containing protein n=1 Tax=Actinidia rufa TaxID=165716 RepID=A0A7J0ET71_9ERIC|nr:BSD domain-containing protein [Actinidia rufa]
MEIWQKAKVFAEEAAKRTQTLTSPAKIADIVSETTKRSKEFAAEASKKADEIRAVADQRIKSLADQIPSSLALLNAPPLSHSPAELEKFGITDDLREFVRGLTSSTFQNFPVQDDLPMSDVPTISNIRQDLTEWQQKHASLVLTTVQEMSRLRYELCPRHMKDANFWRIYFTLVSTHVSPYEKQYVEEIKLKEAEKIKDDKVHQTSITNQKSMTSTSSSAEQDLDTFLLGDLEDGDVGPDDGDEDFDDDFDKIDNSDVEDEKQ